MNGLPGFAGRNPFAIDPTGGVDLGKSIAQGFRMREMADQREARESAQARSDEAHAALKAAGNDPTKLYSIMNQYPELAEELRANLDWHDEQSAKRHHQDYLGIYKSGNMEDAKRILQQRIIEGERRGIDMMDTRRDLAAIHTGQWTDEDLKNHARLELMGSEEGQQFLQAEQDLGADQEYKMGTGDMAGWVFNAKTGEYKIDPKVKAELHADALREVQSKQRFEPKDVKAVNDNVTKLLGSSRDIYQAAKDLRLLQEGGSAADKTAAVFKFMKALDPSSTVRESEQGQVYSAKGPAAELAGILNNLRGKGKLNDKIFAEIVATSEKLSDSATAEAYKETDSYLNVLKKNLTDEQYRDMLARVPERIIVERDAESGHPTTNRRGWGLQRDANGNYAYVGPNNEIDPV